MNCRFSDFEKLDMKKEIVKICIEKGFFLDKEMMDYFLKLDIENVKKIIDTFFGLGIKEKIINKKVFDENYNKIKNFLEIKQENSGNLENSVKILSNEDIVSRKIEINDFIEHFKSRFNIIKNIFEEKGFDNLSSIRRIGQNQGIYTIIGAVVEKRLTKNKNLLIEIEDLTGRCMLLVNKEKKEVFDLAKELLLDDILAFKVSGTSEMLFINEIIFPDCSLEKEKFGKNDNYIAFSGDFHIGSRNFLEKNVLKFIDWLNGDIGDERQKQISQKIKYLFLVGDNIDGVGIFQDQDTELNVKSSRKQYEKFTEILKKIRKDIQIVICAGQHDSVWVGEQQKSIPIKWAPELYEMENVKLVTNPSFFEIEDGFKVLMYHGAGINRFIDEIPRLRMKYGHKHPTKIVKEMLKRRHLSPTHGIFDYVPNKFIDSMAIKDAPDIVFTGDQHRSEFDYYNNILLISSSCWQSQTPFEEKVGNVPIPAQVPILSLKTKEIKIIDFSSGGDMKDD